MTLDDICESYELNSIVLSIIWPPLATLSVSETTKGNERLVACGAYIGTSPLDVCKRLGCHDMTEDVMDLSDAITKTLALNLLYTNFTWDSVFVGLDVSEKHIRQLPAVGYALVLLLGEFSDVVFSIENCVGSSICRAGEMMIARPDTIKTKGLGIGGCYVIVLYDSGTLCENYSDRIDQRKPKQRPLSEIMAYMDGEASCDSSMDDES